MLGVRGSREEQVEFFCSRSAVNSIEKVPLRKDLARKYPAMRIGKWHAMAELGRRAGFCIYDAFCVENSSVVGRRVEADELDAIMRAGLMKQVVEQWKRQNELRDEIVSPNSYPNMGNYWTHFMASEHSGGATLYDVVGHLCSTKYVSWSWQITEVRTVQVTVTPRS